MRTKYVYIFLVLAGFIQGQGFKVKHLIPHSSDNSTKAIFEISPGNYLGAGFIIDTLNGIPVNKIIITGLNSQGQVVWIKKHGVSAPEYINNGFISRCFYKQGTNIYYSGCVIDTGSNVVGIFIKFNFNGDTIWQKTYDDATMDVIPQMVTGSVEGGFLITGFFQDWANNTQPCLLIKTDANGNELWRKKINKAVPNVSDGKAILQDSASKKIVIAGYQYIGNATSWNMYDNVLILDSMGVKLAQKSYVSLAGGSVLDMIQTQDKKIVIGGYQYYPPPIEVTSGQRKSFAAKIDIDTPQLPDWKINGYDELSYVNAVSCITELPNKDLLLAGILDTLGLHSGNENCVARITKVDPSGNIISNRHYDYRTTGPQTNNYIGVSAIEPTSDGGHIISIESINMQRPNPFFFVKFDSTGCDSTLAYCATLNLVGIKEAAKNDPDIKIYPNPADDFFTIKMNSFIEDHELSITDSYGREVKRTQIEKDENIDIYRENISDLSKGIYLLIISKNKQIIYKTKLIKE